MRKIFFLVGVSIFAAAAVACADPKPDAIVAADGSGQFTSLQEAISTAPLRTGRNAPRWVILVRPGTYRERIYVQRERGNIHVLGEDAGRTIVEYDLNANLPGPDGKPIGTFRTPTVQVDGDGMLWENITFANTAGPVGQALALRADGDRLEFRKCRFLGWQDTILLNRGRHYFEDCYIEGHVDFIFGAATAYFSRCHVHCLRDGYITAASTPEGAAHGFVFADCRITGAPGVQTYLGRPWRDFAKTVFLRTEMSEVVRPAGWHNWDKAAAEHSTFYAEFGSRGPGAAAPGKRAAWAKTLAPESANAFSPAKVLAGDDAWEPMAAAARGADVWVPDLGDGRYRNPVLHADYSDPDAVRVGGDYWMTSSSFGHAPALPVLHSRDLVNWTLVTHALPRLVPETAFATPQHGKGVWAPAIRFHAGRYWIYYPDPDFGLYVITASDPRGPWSAPILVKGGKGLIDPCPLWDDDGKIYLVHAWAKSRSGINNVLTLLRLDESGTAVAEDLGVVINGDRIPGYTTLEGPKLYRRNGWYYVFAPAGGVSTGWQAVFRSRNIRGPYEVRSVLAQGTTTVNGPHQGALVDTPSGEWWFLHFQDKGAYGRIVHLQPVVWADDWPRIGTGVESDAMTGEPVLVHRKPDLPAQPIAVPPTSDEFDASELGRQWQWQANPGAGWHSLTESKGKLRLAAVPAPKADSLYDAPNLLLQKFPAPEFTVTTRLDAAPRGAGVRAGLMVFGYDYAWIGVKEINGASQIVLVRNLKASEGGAEKGIVVGPAHDGPVWLRVSVTNGARCRFAYSYDGEKYTTVEHEFTATAGRWVGAKAGLFVTGAAGAASFGDFDFFRVSP